VKPARQSFLLLMVIRWALPPRMLPMKNDVKLYGSHFEEEQQDGANLNALCCWKQARYEKARSFFFLGGGGQFYDAVSSLII
jgi:hypothetical protein